jgi:hypothetical protein
MLEQLEIRTKGAKIIKLRRDDPFAWAQREFVAEVERQYNAGLPVRIIVLKGRQVGISTVVEAIIFIWGFLHPNCFSLVLSREKDDSKYLFTMFKRYWEKGPFYDLFDTKYDTKDELVFEPPIGSTVRVATATKDEVGRGMTIQAAHCSEVAFWGDQVDTIIPGLENAIAPDHGTIWIHESTAQGVGGYFHDEWQEATDPDGHSDFTAMFFPWFCHDEYETPTHNLTYEALEDDGKYGDEKGVVGFLLNADVSPAHVLAKMAWRRRKINNAPKGLDGFHEEYPCTPDEAFLSTGSNVFALEHLAQCYKQVGYDRGYLFNDGGKLAFNATDAGHMTVYKTPDPKRRQKYALGCDPTKTIEGDPACIQVINRATMEQVAVWHGAANPNQIGQIALAMGYWYNDALMNTEIQGGGREVMQIWRDAGYSNIWTDRRPDKARRSAQLLGWNTTYETKQWLIGVLQGVITRHDVVIHHPATYHELRQYTCLEDGTFGPARRSGHDDCVMAYGVAVMTAVTEWSSLNLNEVYGTGGSGEQGPSASRLVVANQGRIIDEIPGMVMTRDDLPVYAQAGEIDDWY